MRQPALLRLGIHAARVDARDAEDLPGAHPQRQAAHGGNPAVVVDGEVGDKKQYDPRVWGAKAEEAMAARVVQACTELNSAGKSIG